MQKTFLKERLWATPSRKQMNKKTWTEKLKGLKKLKDVAKFHEKKAIDDQEELGLMISAIEAKILTFK